MTNQNVTTVSEALASCSFIPSSYGYRGVSVTQFAYSDLSLKLSGINFDPIAGVLSVQTAMGVVQCVLRYLPADEVAPLCDAVSAAVSQGAEVRLARVPQAGPRWFCGIVLSSDYKEQKATVDPRPWSTWKA